MFFFPQINDTVVPMLWFEEGLDELGPELVSAISEAVHAPPQYKNYILCTFLGLFLSTSVIGVVALVRCCLNKRRTRSDAVLKNTVKNILASGGAAGGGDQSGAGQEQPMLGGGSSTESSRVTTANHSRNTSTGSSNFVSTSKDAERLQLLLDDPSSSRLPSKLVEEVV